MNRFLFLLSTLLWGCGTSDLPYEEHNAKTAKIAEVLQQPNDSSLVNFNESELPEHVSKAERIGNYLEKLCKRKQFNGCVLVSEGGEIVLKRSYGYANFETDEELTPKSSFHLASVSKQFTAASIMLLKEEGKINLEDDVTKYIPEIPYKGIKIKHLLNHSSGLVNFLNYVPTYLCFWDSCKIARNSELPIILQEKKPRLQFKPGTRFAYNNTGYVLLAHVVERISGLTFQEFVQKRIFDVLNMKDSKVVSIADEPIVKNRVYNYVFHRRSYQIFDDDVRNGFVGEKGVYSSIEDMYKWDQALYTDKLLNKASRIEMMDYSKLDNGRRIMYGYGWRKSKDNPDFVYHFGHWKGARACIMRYTDTGNTIIILNNTGSNTLKRIAHKIKLELKKEN